MRVHLVVDYSFLYYKYFFQLQTGRMKKLTAPIDWNGAVSERDISQIYYSIREIESFRKQFESIGHEVTMSICFDSKSSRGKGEDATEADKLYKSNRVSKLTDDDFTNILIVQSILDDAGYNTYKYEGYEADDIVNHLATEYKDKFDATIIYTPDADLAVNICEKVMLCRYKTGKGYTNILMSNFSNYLEAEMKVERMPYNAVMLYKCTVGDSSDNIKGIGKFGPKAFDKLVKYLDSKQFNWEVCRKFSGVEQALELCSGYLSEDQINQAKESLSLVRPMVFENNLPYPEKLSTAEMRETAFMRASMKSLIV